LLPNGIKRDLVAAFRGIHGPGDERMDRQGESIEASGAPKTDAPVVVATTAQGAIVGAIISGGKGAAITGAAAGLATVLLARSRNLVLDPGTQFDLELQQPLRFTLNEIYFTPDQIESARRTPLPPTRNQAAPGRNPSGRIGTFGWPW